jgi:hypothetical protein
MKIYKEKHPICCKNMQKYGAVTTLIETQKNTTSQVGTMVQFSRCHIWKKSFRVATTVSTNFGVPKFCRPGDPVGLGLAI